MYYNVHNHSLHYPINSDFCKCFLKVGQDMRWQKNNSKDKHITHQCMINTSWRVQSLSCVQLFATPRTAARLASLSITNSRSLLKLMSIKLVMPSNHLSSVIPFSSHLQSFPASGSFPMSQFFRWPKYWSFSFNISPSNEYSRLISFRMDWLGLLAVQGNFKSLLQHHSSKASILRCSAL